MRKQLGQFQDVAPKAEADQISQSVNWLGRAVLPDRSGYGWFVRLTVLFLLVIGTGAYALIAYHDERQELAEKRHERSGGQKAWFDRILGLLGHRSTNPPKRSGSVPTAVGGASWVIKLLALLETVEAVGFLTKVYKKMQGDK